MSGTTTTAAADGGFQRGRAQRSTQSHSVALEDLKLKKTAFVILLFLLVMKVYK